MSLYADLAMECKKWMKNSNLNTDVGSGGHFTRFVTSVNELFDENQVKEHILSMNIYFSEGKIVPNILILCLNFYYKLTYFFDITM